MPVDGGEDAPARGSIFRQIKKRPLPRIGRGRFILTLVFRWARPRSLNHRNRNQRLRNRSSTRSRSWLRNHSSTHSNDCDGTSGRGSRGCSSDGAGSKVRSTTIRSHSWLRNRTRLQRRNHSSAQRRSWLLRHNHSWLRNRRSVRSSKARSSCCDVGTSGTSSNRRRRSPIHNHTPAHNNHGDGRRTPKRCRHTTRQRPGPAPQQQNEGSSHDSYRYSNGGGGNTLGCTVRSKHVASLLTHVASVERRLRRRIVAFAWRTTLDSSSHAIVNPAWPA